MSGRQTVGCGLSVGPQDSAVLILFDGRSREEGEAEEEQAKAC